MDTTKLQRYQEETQEAHELLEQVSTQGREMAARQRFSAEQLPEVWQQDFEALGNLNKKTFSYYNPSSNKPDPRFSVGMIAFLSLLGYGVVFYFAIGTNAALLMFGLTIAAAALTALLYSISPSVRKMKQFLKDLELAESQRATIKALSGQVSYKTASSLLVPLVTWLKEEMKPNALLHLDLNTSYYKNADEFKQTGDFGQRATRHLFPYMTLKTRLADGSVFQLNTVYQIDSQTSTKRSRSGKWKAKTKTKVRIMHTLQLRVAQQRYELTTTELPADIKFKESDKWLTIRAKFVDKTSNMDKQPEFDHIMQLAHKAYKYIKVKGDKAAKV